MAEDAEIDETPDLRGMLTEADLGRIKAAVSEAEKGVSGEIVVYVAPTSHDYPETPWMGLCLGGGFGGAVILALDLWRPLWAPLPMILAAVLGCAGAGLVLGLFACRVKRLWIGAERLDLMAHRGAREAFLEKEVFRTRDRTGILLYVSLFEHEVVVLGDAGINAKVGAGEWDAVVATVTDGVRRGALADGIVAGVAQCREILLKAGFKARRGDKDELPDEPGLGGGKKG